MTTTYAQRAQASASAQDARPYRGDAASGWLIRATLAAAGVGFVLYPLIRPFSDETSRAGARAFASPAWVWAHGIGMGAFVLLGLGTTGWLLAQLRGRAPDRRATTAVMVMWSGIGLTLPYYGAEAFGLHALGQAAVHGNSSAMRIVHGVRWEQGLWFILLGLCLLAVAAVLAAIVVWRTHRRRWAGLPLAAALLLYIPQFAAGQPVRVAHGLLMLLGCVCLATTANTRPHPAR